MHKDNPLIIQNDGTILIEVQNFIFNKVREYLSEFAELIKNPDYIHTYKITSLTLWNAAEKGLSSNDIIDFLEMHSKFFVPKSVINNIQLKMEHYGLITFITEDKKILCRFKNTNVMDEILNYSTINQYFGKKIDDLTIEIVEDARGILKQELIKIGYPVKDLGGYIEGEFLPISILPITKKKEQFQLREYQRNAVATFVKDGSFAGGSGVLVLPCGSGKTIIGIGVINEIKNETLILTTNTVAVHQWIDELVDKTSLTLNEVGEYTGEIKNVKPVTVATYQILTHRTNKNKDFVHMKLFQERNWGLIIYDEVHLLPAPVFRFTANIQAKKRLGLTATLVREDKKEDEVFSLIGPKIYDASWKEMEQLGWIAKASCIEVRLPMTKKWHQKYITASKRERYKIAATNPSKIDVIRKIINKHQEESILIIGQYVAQLQSIAKKLNVPLITGKTKQAERKRIYQEFKDKEKKIIVVSKVANFAIDLPDANIAIQVSGTFGSRQEEAQRLGRILRPKKNNSDVFFYTLISQDTVDQDYALKRQLFLVENGYQYEVEEVY